MSELEKKCNELCESELSEVSGGGNGYYGYQDYYCAQGDNLEIVAGKFHTSAAALITLNNLTSPYLKPNQHLLVPKVYK